MSHSPKITFDCLPLRTVGRLDIPLDASPVFRQRCENILAAIKYHGSHNAYYLHNASCTFHLTNDPAVGELIFKFEGTVLTNELDVKCKASDLNVELQAETCSWLTEPIVDWFKETIQYSVRAEFDRYISVGNLDEARKRAEELQQKAEEEGGFMGMYL